MGGMRKRIGRSKFKTYQSDLKSRSAECLISAWVAEGQNSLELTWVQHQQKGLEIDISSNVVWGTAEWELESEALVGPALEHMSDVVDVAGVLVGAVGHRNWRCWMWLWSVWSL